MASPSSTLQELIPFEISSSDIRGLEDKDIRGSGSYGAVYAVTVKGNSRIAKRLHSILVDTNVSQSEKQGIRERFLNECLLLSKLDHPNVVKFVGVHFNRKDRSDVTLIMERLHMDLNNFLKPDQSPNIDTYTKLSILLDVSSGLLYLHTQLAKPVIHRDLTAVNVLLTEDFKRAKIADLGVSKLIVDHLHRAETRTMCPGAHYYMPPEALIDKPKYDTPLDVFSFGHLSLYVALQQFPCVYEPPSDQSIESIRAYQLGEVAILKRKKWLDMLPEDHCLRDLILSCLRDKPSERPSTERLNVKMKVLCGLELEKFEIKDVMGIIGGELYGSYTAIYKVIARGAPRIAKRLNSILDSELHSDISPSERQHIRERFHSECLALSKLDHSSILKFIGVHFNPEDRSDMSIIFEHLHMSLEEFLNSQEFPDIHLNTKLSILYDVSCGLLYLHTQLELPFTHGELTAANILLTDDLRQVKIADLGVLKLWDSYVNMEHKNSRALAYLPQEAFLDNPKRATPIDVFSFGHLALYVALQRFPEISEEKVLTVTRKKREIEILRRKKWIDELKQDHCLRDLILQCLKDEPEKRPTAKELNNDIMDKLNSATNPERKTKPPQNQFAELCRICRSGRLDLLKDFLYYNKEILNYSTSKGSTILHEAVEGDQPDVIQLLILHGFNPDVQAKGGITPLHLAVTNGQIDCVRALIENGADISVRDNQGQDAITKAEQRSKKRDSETVMKYLSSKQIIQLAEAGEVNELEKRLSRDPKPEICDMEEAVFMAIRKNNDECVPLLIVAGVRCLDCALELAIQLDRISAIAILLLCKGGISGDTVAIHSLLYEPLGSINIPWYMPKVHEVIYQGSIQMWYPIAVSIFEKKYEATKELLLRTDLDMVHKQVDWSKLKLPILHSSWMYSIAPWVVSLKLTNNHLRMLPSEMCSATQLRRLDLSQNLLETISPDLFALPNLEYLSISHNRLKEIPETSNWSGSLLSLDLSDNLLITLPQGIQHSSIEIFNLSKNQFTVMPKCLCHIRSLTSLDLSYMPISSLPREMENLAHLINLNVSNTNLPSGGGVLQGVIKGTVRAQQTRSKKPCNHVKLILFCHSNKDHVKIVLSKLNPQLMPNLPLPEIDIFQWSFKSSNFSRAHYFNTWLIGSDYSCRSIFPCFFTPSALYVIVWDTTTDLREHIKPYIDLLIRYVPLANILFIAILQKQYTGGTGKKQTEELAARLNKFLSKPSYQSLCYHRVMIVDRQSELKQGLYNAAQQMIVNGQKVVGRQIPETYFSLIPVLEKEQQAFRSTSEPGVLEESTIWMLFNKTLALDPPNKMELPDMVDFLKEIGLLLHYGDPNDHLDQCYFTQPIWLYNTLLQIVQRALQDHNRLLRTHSELCFLANISWNKDIAQALIRLMIRYAIVLPVRRDQYLITCLLPHSQPLTKDLYCGVLRRQFAPRIYSIPIDLWSRLLCSIISNLPRIVDMSKLKKESKGKEKEMGHDTDDETDERGLATAIAKKQLPEYLDQAHSKMVQEKSRQPPHTDDYSCNNTPVQSETEMEEVEFEKESVKVGEKSDEEPKESKYEETPPSEQPNAAAAATECVTQKGIKEESPISPTANGERMASRVLRMTSPVKHFSRGRLSISDCSQTQLTSSTPVNGQMQASNPQHSSEGSRHVSAPPKTGDLSRHSECTMPIAIDEGVEIWESGIMYNHKGIKFSIYSCLSEVSTVKGKGIEICCTRDNCGYTIMARLCWLVQRNLEERFPNLFSTETPLQKHELTQIAICPTCLEKDERNHSCFLIEACIHALQLKGEHDCRYHPEKIPLRDLVPDYLLLDFPSHLHLTKSMFEYNEAEPLHRGGEIVIHNGHFNGKEVAIKIYHHVDSGSITLPLSCVRREIDMLTSLNHPNIIETLGFCLDPPCILIEKAPLGNLYQKLMDTEVKINRTVRFHIANQVASALSYLHQRDIIYRTLKASSILLWSLDFKCDASVKLANFERAAYQSPSGLMSKTTFSSYSAPEMVRYSFREEYTEKVDIYSFGMFLYELVTRWQPNRNDAHSKKPKPSGVVTTIYSTLVKLMQECWQDESMARPSANGLLLQLSQPSFQCHLASQVLHDCLSVRGCCFVPSVGQIWVYGEYNMTCLHGEGETSEGTRIFILNAENMTVQGSLELRERAMVMFTVDNKVWIGMTDLCVHAYDTTTFQFTDRFHLDDSATIIADNDCYVFVGQANGQIKCYSKLQLQRGDCQPVVIQIGDKAIIAMVTVGDVIWIGCGNELVILSAEDEIMIEQRAEVCESSDNVYAMTVSHITNTVWCITRSSRRIISWDLHTTELKQSVDLSEQLEQISCQLNYDPSFLMRMVSIECVSDTLWVGLSRGVIMILSDAEHPEKIIHFKAHAHATRFLLKIPLSDVFHQQHEYPMMLSGGLGEVSSLSSEASEHFGVVMLWQACTANEFSTIAKRHANYVHVLD